MSAKKYFILLQRIIFVLFTLLFLKVTFYKWDGYSFYMRFTDFLPDLSLSYILWTIPGIFIAFFLWILAYGINKTFKKIRLEYIIAWIIIIVIIHAIRHIFFVDRFNNSLTNLNDLTILLISSILSGAVIFLINKHTEAFLSGINTRITPLVWLFVAGLLIALPCSGFSVFRKEPPAFKYVNKNSAHVSGINNTNPNIILITWDTLAARDMGLYGYNRPTTPYLSEWAKDAVVFKRLYAASNWTVPTSMSLMTGQRVWTHKVWYDALNSPVKNYTDSLPHILKENGYNIYGWVQNPHAHPDTLGIGRSFLTKDNATTFNKFLSNGKFRGVKVFFKKRPVIIKFMKKYPYIFVLKSVEKLAASANMKRSESNPVKKENGTQNQQSIQDTGDHPQNPYPPKLVYNRFLDYMSSSIQETEAKQLHEPFFAWLHLYPPHSPYLPPKSYRGMFGGDNDKPDEMKYTDAPEDFEYKPEDQPKVDELRKRYDEFILYSDEQFRVFMKKLSEKMDLSNTIIVFSADHGESFSHGYKGHVGDHLFEQFVHVPLVIKMPGRLASKVIDMPVEQIDIAPTILDLAGIAVPTWMEGRSLYPLIEGKSLEAQTLFSMQLIRNRSFGTPVSTGTIAIWDGNYKLIYYLKDKKSLLFNLGTDPEEMQNILNDEPEIADRLLKLIEVNLSGANNKITRLTEYSN